MAETREGVILNVSSMSAFAPLTRIPGYSAAKAGMHGFTKAVAQETIYKNITVNTISPGYVETEMTRAIAPEIMEAIIKQIPAGRMGTPEEVARVVTFLASPAASLVTGINLVADNGFTKRVQL